MTISAALLILLRIATANGSTDARPPVVPVQVAHGVTIWPKGSLRRITLCSRKPPSAPRTWTPRWRDIVRVETLLPWAIRDWRNRTRDRNFLTPGQFEQSDWEARWTRNYFGIVRAGRRHLYIDFAPSPMRDGFSFCDGGSFLFGIEIDVSSGTIVALDTNAVA